MEENLPPGFRFHPTDEELIVYYLTQKVSDSSFTSRSIAVVDLKKCEPWDLPGKASMGEKEWYFFNLRDRKYPTGLRTNRATASGYWKTTGKDKEIFHSGAVVGMKKTLVFYKGRAPRGEKSNWVMHEYRLENKHPLKTTKEEWVVCRVFQKMVAVTKPQQTISPQPSLDESHYETRSIANEFGDIEPQNLSTITNSSTPFGNIMSSQNYNSDIGNVNTNTNLNINWPIATDQIPTLLPSLQWPPGLLGTNLSVNSLLLKALQLKSTLHSRDTTTALHNYAYMAPQLQPQPPTSQFGNELTSSDFSASTSKVLDYMAPQQQQQQQQPEQPFDLDNINECMHV